MSGSGSIRNRETSTILVDPLLHYVSKIATCKKVVITSLYIRRDRFLPVTMTSASWRKSQWIVGESSQDFNSYDTTYVHDARSRVRTRACKFVHKTLDIRQEGYLKFSTVFEHPPDSFFCRWWFATTTIRDYCYITYDIHWLHNHKHKQLSFFNCL